ncbi:single-stranded-DNA-specific exonuclease RecJ [uncultured Methylovirgula sp.]|uniref:single-stranded-DNA-specific exonuclease RecJ n=1 Tax=uncultured Methylovirgula sp. TaxID=1285960 RepID=UPI0026326BDD|nr:single-stranded-DNA-specific exonuclease RecJ [uncultured Methylovirgula sp.]
MSQPLPFAPNKPFLGVLRSALGRPWRARLDAAGQARALAISQAHGLSDLLARVLAGRGVGLDEATAYLDPTLRRLLPDPSCLADMDAAAARLAAAIRAGETVAIFGDYDVDGAASAALIGDFLTAAGTSHRIHIPDRIFEGYGPNVQAITALAEADATLLVCVDCGTTSHAPLAEARRLGLDVIVLDHHQAPERLPPALVVNPNRQDDLSGLGQLCAAGVVFLALIATNRLLRAANFWSAARPEPDLLIGLDLVALATIADVAPLTGLNRALVTKGLALMRARGRPGLAALLDVAGAGGPPTAHHLGFLIGPRINAGGRIGDAALGAKLLASRDPVAARQIAEDLNRLNRERQTVEAATLEIAVAEAEAAAERAGVGAAIVVAGDGWHPGVVGLVAARLKERFRRPAFAIAFQGEAGTGSGRSIPGVDLGRIVRQAVEAGLLIKGGGHAMAAGITLERSQLGAFAAYVEAELDQAVAAALASEALLVDASLSAAGAGLELYAALEKAGPFGAGNPEPVFAFPAHRLIDVMPLGEGHLRWRAKAADGAGLEGILFRAAQEPLGLALSAARGQPVHLAGQLVCNRWNGRERIEVRLIDLAPAEPGGAAG